MRFFDSHAHYWDSRFEEELGKEETDALLSSLLANEVPRIVNVATSPETALLTVSQAQKYDGMLTALGIHPSDCQQLRSIDDALLSIEGMLKDPRSKAVALGEIGLDYHYEDTQKEKQQLYFREQLKLAERLALPVVIHDRDAHGDILRILSEFPSVSGILHSYSGSAEMAKELIGLGYYISFSGTVTFKNAERVRKVASALPPDRLLIETDCPYLSPDPYRGRLNHSGRLSLTLAALASAVGIEAEAYAETVYQNTLRAYRL